MVHLLSLVASLSNYVQILVKDTCDTYYWYYVVWSYSIKYIMRKLIFIKFVSLKVRLILIILHLQCNRWAGIFVYNSRRGGSNFIQTRKTILCEMRRRWVWRHNSWKRGVSLSVGLCLSEICCRFSCHMAPAPYGNFQL